VFQKKRKDNNRQSNIVAQQFVKKYKAVGQGRNKKCFVKVHTSLVKINNLKKFMLKANLISISL
jgi:hypothetical protein